MALAARCNAGLQRPAAHSRSRAVQCAAQARDGLLGRRLPLISKISHCVEHTALVQKFELLAARSAMMGCLATVVFELSGTRIVALDPDQGSLFAATLLLAVSASASLAFARRRAGGRLLLEGVVSSLTCAGRSASSLTSLTPSSLDANVDLVIESAFDQEMTEWLKTSLDEQEAAAIPSTRVATA